MPASKSPANFSGGKLMGTRTMELEMCVVPQHLPKWLTPAQIVHLCFAQGQTVRADHPRLWREALSRADERGRAGTSSGDRG